VLDERRGRFADQRGEYLRVSVGADAIAAREQQPLAGDADLAVGSDDCRQVRDDPRLSGRLHAANDVAIDGRRGRGGAGRRRNGDHADASLELRDSLVGECGERCGRGEKYRGGEDLPGHANLRVQLGEMRASFVAAIGEQTLSTRIPAHHLSTHRGNIRRFLDLRRSLGTLDDMPLKTTSGNHGEAAKGRGATINPEGRFENFAREAFDDEWFQEAPEGGAKPKTVIAIERAKSVISRHDSPDVGFAQSLNPYRGCAHGCVYCLHGDTPILMGDGRTRPMSELRPGDEVYGTVVERRWRRYTKTRVLDHWSSIKPAYRTTLHDGTELISSADHRFLSDRGWKYLTGDEHGAARRPFLTINDKLMGTGRFAEAPYDDDEYRRGYLCGVLRGDGTLGEYADRRPTRAGQVLHRFRLALCDPQALLRAQDYLLDFEVPTEEFTYSTGTQSHRPAYAIRAQSARRVGAIRDLIAWPGADASTSWLTGFLAGIFDAEGSFSQTVLRISNTDHLMIGWTIRALEALRFRYVVEQPCVAPNRKPIKVVRLKGGLREQLRFIHTVFPAITRKLDIQGQALKSDAQLGVVSIEALGQAMRLYDVTTGTGDFIANGVVSHNCFARPSHAYIGLSPGLDFETRLSVKTNAADRLREEIARPGYKVEPLTIGVNTDAYQPIEREHRITRAVLELCRETDHPVTLITKSALIERDIDLLAPMARKNLVSATLSITSLDQDVTRYMEPRTSAPARRLLAVKRLSDAGIPVNVNIAPVIPFLTDHELEAIMEAAVENGATSAFYNLVRLPWEVKDIFRAWLEERFPLKAAHVMSRINEMRDGKDNDPSFGTRMTGTGLWAELLRQRYEKACKRLGLDKREEPALDCTLFRPPSLHGQQTLF
jgi:DNA repair photolyase